MSRALRDLHVLFEDASQIALSPPAVASWWKGRLDRSPSSSAFRPKPVRLQLLSSTPLLGLSKDCPFVDTRFERPLPGSISATQAPHFSHPSAWSCHRQARSVLVVPPDFDGFLRSSAAGLLHPAADHGVRSVLGPPVTSLKSLANDRPSPRTLHPSEFSPPDQRHFPVTRAPTLSLLHRPNFNHFRDWSDECQPQSLLRPRVRCELPALPRISHP